MSGLLGSVGSPGADGLGAESPRPLMALVQELYPVLRSITGAGLRATLDVLRRELPRLEVRSVPSGAQVLDWTVPPEWTVREAHLTAPDGTRVVDVRRHNLSLVNYSAPFRGTVPLTALRPHLHSLPDRPHAIPYRTSYYRRAWGFCLPHEVLERLPDGDYQVVIDTDLAPGVLNYGELVLPGEREDEVLLSAHVCHPSLANDNLSAVAVLVELARRLTTRRRRLTYRLLFAPGTIGAIAALSRSLDLPANAADRPETADANWHHTRVRHGLVLAGLGDGGTLHYKRSRDGAKIDRVVAHVLRHHGEHRILPFDPGGYDERQYASPGFRLAVGRLGRTPPGTYPEYHTSDDDLSFVTEEALQDASTVLERVVDVLERDAVVRSLAPYGEPQLGRRGLYESDDPPEARTAMQWVLNLADGEHGLLDVAERAGLSFAVVADAADRLVQARLIALEEAA
ncbi:MAG: DUF4910 domain-containing protein [Trueperaceae bacterium]